MSLWREWLTMVVIIALATCAANAQQPSLQAPRAYDVCSVKPSPASARSAARPATGGGINWIGASTESLVTAAFDVEDSQIFGLPAWAKEDRYDVACKDTERAVSKEEYWPRVRAGTQALLADRFRLHFHRGTRPLPVAALTVGKGGLKVTPSTGSVRGGSYGPAFLKAQAWSLEELASTITSLTGTKVIDRTGIADRYDFELEWTLDEEPAPGEARRPGGLVDLPMLSALLNEKLGLVIKRMVESTEVILVDHIEKPGEN